MSSLSQEDLDAGWDDAEIGAARPTVPVDPNTIPPTSMIREKQRTELASGVAAGSTADVAGSAVLDATSGTERDTKQLETQAAIDAEPSGAVTRENEADAAIAPQRTAVKRGLRWLAWGGAALLLVAIGYSMLMRSKHANTRVKPASSLQLGEAVRAPTQGREPSGSTEGAAMRGIAAPGSSGMAQSPEGVTAPVSESFSDAFVKHAASVNSNWSEVKKRPRVAETQSASRPKSGVNASGENPLGVLDQLEKARKAKRMNSNQP